MRGGPTEILEWIATDIRTAEEMVIMFSLLSSTILCTEWAMPAAQEWMLHRLKSDTCCSERSMTCCLRRPHRGYCSGLSPASSWAGTPTADVRFSMTTSTQKSACRPSAGGTETTPASSWRRCHRAATLCPSVSCRRRARWSAFTARPAPACCCCSWLTVCGWKACCSVSASAYWGSTSLCELRYPERTTSQRRAHEGEFTVVGKHLMWGFANVTFLFWTGQKSVHTTSICLSECFATLWRTWIYIYILNVFKGPNVYHYWWWWWRTCGPNCCYKPSLVFVYLPCECQTGGA